MQEKYLVTPALPYANGPIHLGHLVEHIQVNIFVRALKMADKDVLYVCGADCHGTPIEMNALRAKQKPEDFVKSWQQKHEQSFKQFGISFDGGFGSTHSQSNQEHAEKVFLALKEKGLVRQSEIEQLFDPELGRFLPDRMVRGTCPYCKQVDQYGDSCEGCGRTYQPTDLIEPKSALSGATPILKKSVHYFVSLSHKSEELKAWAAQNKTVHNDVRAYLNRWFEEGLKDWDISRDGPYFGFLIPGEQNKYFYVWLDAPIGYISLTEHAAKQRGRSFSDYWQDKNTKIIHFIGKDIVYFHTLFWPAMLMAAEYTLPSKVVVHGMLTVNGEKMSKSRGTFILADTFAKHFNHESLRYYYACKLGSRPEDIDLSFTDFIQRVNTDLVNKLVNIVSRALPLLARYFDSRPGSLDKNAENLIALAKRTIGETESHYLEHEFAKALNLVVRLSEEANKYLQEQAPWKVVKDDPKKAQEILTTGLYIGKICLGLIKPVMPELVKKLEDMINNGQEYSFANLAHDFSHIDSFKEYEHLFKRIEESQLSAMQDEIMNANKVFEKPEQKESLVNKTPSIKIDAFMQVDMRAAKVLKASAVDGSDKLIEVLLDVGELGQRTVFSGLRPHVLPEDMIGKTVVVVANLEPRKMRFGLSEGMILAAGDSDPEPLFLTKAKAGARVG